jgi:hypothetical protein
MEKKFCGNEGFRRRLAVIEEGGQLSAIGKSQDTER